MKRLSAVFSARMGAVLASAALLSGCVVMPVEGGYRHHDRYEHYESHDRYDRYEGHHTHRYGHPPPPRAERRPRPPGPGYAWSQGRWVWSGQRYHWQPAAGTTCARHRHRTCALGRHPTPIALGRPHMPNIRPGGTAPQRRLAPGLSAPMGTFRPQRSTKTHGVFSLETQRPQSLIAIAGRAVPSRVQRPCNATGLGAYIKMCSASLPPPKIT